MKENNVNKTIDDYTFEVTSNEKIGKVVKEKFKKNQELIKSLIQIIYNYENERNTRSYDNDEYLGGTKIAYLPQNIDTFDERLINEDYVKIYKDNNKNEFIPGFQYINKEKLEDFINLIIEGEVQLKAANVITQMVAYLEVMLARVLDMVFLSIQKYLYDRLTNDEMICHIRNEMHSLNFALCKTLIKLKPNLEEKRTELLNNIKKLKKALKTIQDLSYGNNSFSDDELEKKEKKEKNFENSEEEDEK